jgi:hypothetical protein
MAKMSKKEFNDAVESQKMMLELAVELEKVEFKRLSLYDKMFDSEKKRKQIINEIAIHEQSINVQTQQLTQNKDNMSKRAKNQVKQQIIAEKEQLEVYKKQNKQIIAKGNNLKNVLNLTTKILGASTALLGSITSWDKPMREAVLNLGLGAEKGEQMKNAFYDATPAAIALGGSMADLRDIQTQYAEGTSRTVGLTAQELINVEEIARGTTLGAAGAGKLAGQFAIMGKDIKQTHEFIQGVVDASQRMGINSNNVIKSLSDNYKKLNSFGFKAGVEGMKKMAIYSEKFKISISEALDSADMARTLEGSIEMAATLNTLGGEFAKSDPFELLNLSRNDPAKYTQKINEMTKGMASLVKTADGFEMQVTPLDLDRLREASKALGIPYENLVEQTKQMGHYQKMNNQLVGKGFSKDQLETIQAMAKLDGKSGIYKVMGKNIADLTAAEIEKLKLQQTTLAESAKNAQTFDEKFENTIKLLKSSLLPLLDGVNSIMEFIQPFVIKFGEAVQWMTKTDFGKGAALFLGGALIFEKTFGGGILSKVLGKSGKGGSAAGSVGGAGGAKGGAGASFGSGAGGALKAIGQGAGVGLASAGIGAGINIAAQGIAKLADSMAKLTPDQAKTLQNIAMTLAISFPLAAIGIAVVAAVAAPAAPVLLALGASMLLIGAAVGIAAAGIGYMAGSFGNLLKSAEPKKVFQLAAGIAALSVSMYAFAGAGLLATLGGGGMIAQLLVLAALAPRINQIGESFKNIGTVLNANPESLNKFKETLDAISNFKSGDSLSELKDLFAKPLRVEFDKKNVSMNVDVNVKVDSDVLARVVAKKVASLQVAYSEGRRGN